MCPGDDREFRALKRSIRRLELVALVGCLLTFTAEANADSALPPRIIIELQSGDLSQALSDMRSLPEAQGEGLAKQVASLDYAVTLRNLAEDSASVGAHGEVAKLVAELRQLQLEGLDLAYKEGVLRIERRLDARLREHASAQAQVQLALADELLDAGNVADARKIYDGILAKPESYTPALIATAQARSDAARRDLPLWARAVVGARGALETASLWLGSLTLAVLLIMGLRKLLSWFPQSRPWLAVSDLDGSADPNRPTRDILDLLSNGVEAADGPSLDTIEDVDRSGLSNIALTTRDTDALKDIASGAELIAVAGVSFSPQLLQALLRPLRRPFRTEYNGELRATGAGFRLSLRVHSSGQLSTLVAEDASREEVLAEVADFIAFQSSSWRASENWRSFRALRKAQRLLRATKEPSESKAWQAARHFLEDAVDADPQNFIAQYRLGVLLRRIGKNRDSEDRLRRLDALLWAEKPRASTVRLIERNPDLKAGVRYDLGLCLTKQDNVGKLDKALEVLRSLEAFSSTVTGGPGPARSRFALLTSSALTGVLAAQISVRVQRVPPAHRAKWLSGKIAQPFFEELQRRREDLEQYRESEEVIDVRAASAALAVALAAEGRVLFLRNDLPQAESQLRRAVNENPRLACAATQLAQVLKRHRTATGRTLEAVTLLERALALSPRNQKALYLLGHTYHYQFKESAKARPYLESARACGLNAATDLVYAECLREQGNNTEARDVLESSIRAMENPVNFRYQLLLILMLVHQRSKGALSADEADTAKRCFKRVTRSHQRRPNEYFVPCRKLMDDMGLLNA